eukprot:4592285-Prymnesium_polylepis.1
MSAGILPPQGREVQHVCNQTHTVVKVRGGIWRGGMMHRDPTRVRLDSPTGTARQSPVILAHGPAGQSSWGIWGPHTETARGAG